MEELYELYLTLHTSWDWMHHLGLADKDVSKKGEFKWLRDLSNTCRDIYTHLNWGNDHERLLETANQLKTPVRTLVNFSETRFANSKRRVFQNILLMIAPVLSVLEADILAAEKNRSGLEAANSKLREKGTNARELKARICNQQFLLQLAGVSDIYEQFGKIINIAQSYQLLPHQRLDSFETAVLNLQEMSTKVRGNSSTEIEMPHFEKIRKSMEDKSEVDGVLVLDERPVQGAGLQSSRRSISAQSKENIVHETAQKLDNLIVKLSEKISGDTCTREEKKLIEVTRRIWDLPALALKLKTEISIPVVSASEFPNFWEAVKELKITPILDLSREPVRDQFALFLKRLDSITSHYSVEELTVLDAKILIKKFFDTSGELFKGVEMILHAIAVASTKASCESVLESYVSRYEIHFNARRNMGEDGANKEFVIAQNGPSIVKCDRVVKKAMESYCSEKGQTSWHFIRTAQRTKMFQMGCKVLEKTAKKSSHLGFMN